MHNIYMEGIKLHSLIRCVYDKCKIIKTYIKTLNFVKKEG